MGDFRNNRKSDRAISISVGYLLRNVVYTAYTSPFGIKENAESQKAAPLFRDAVNSSLDSRSLDLS